MLLRYIRGKCVPAYPALYSVLYKRGADSPGPIFDGLARWHGEIFGKVNTPEGELVGGEVEIIAFFQFPDALQENNYVELRNKEGDARGVEKKEDGKKVRVPRFHRNPETLVGGALAMER